MSTEAFILKEGWLYKWVNILKRYQKRWFILSVTHLSYYRVKEDSQTLHGGIGLLNLVIHRGRGVHFVVSDGGTQTFHLRSSNEKEKEQWITAMEFAKSQAIESAELGVTWHDHHQVLSIFLKPGIIRHKLPKDFISDSIPLGNEMISLSELETANQQSPHEPRLRHGCRLRTKQKLVKEFAVTLNQETDDLKNFSDLLKSSFDDLRTFHNRLRKSSDVIHVTVSELEAIKNVSNVYPKLESILNQASGVKEDLSRTLEDCEDLLKLAEEHKNNLVNLKQLIIRRLNHLGKIVDHLAKENSNLTSALQQMNLDVPSVSGISDDEQFYDALEISPNEYFSPFKRSVFRTPPDIKNSVTHGCPHCHSNSLYVDAETDETSDADQQKSSFAIEDLKNHVGFKKMLHRTSLPIHPLVTFNIWSVIKQCVGKDLSRIPMPVYFNEPLSTLQRLTEEYEYASLLHKAASCKDSCLQLLYVAAFVVSSYSSTLNRTGKPFNPLLGETYECDRSADLGWQCISEQVSHHPPILAQHCEGDGWNLWQEFSMRVAVKGASASVTPSGICHLEFKQSGNHYTWNKVCSSVHNIVVGTMWIDHHGELHISNHTTGDKCTVQFSQYKYFKSDSFRKISGVVKDKQSNAQWVLQGRWDEEVKILKVSDVGEELNPKVIWKRTVSCEKKNPFNMSVFACQLNEPEEGVAPTDSRLRPDQRLLEEGKWEEANTVKVQLEEKQRQRRLLREQEAKQTSERGEVYPNYSPAWFTLKLDPITDNPVHIFTGEYWNCKAVQDWKRCPNIFL